MKTQSKAKISRAVQETQQPRDFSVTDSNITDI